MRAAGIGRQSTDREDTMILRMDSARMSDSGARLGIIARAEPAP